MEIYRFPEPGHWVMAFYQHAAEWNQNLGCVMNGMMLRERSVWRPALLSQWLSLFSVVGATLFLSFSSVLWVLQQWPWQVLHLCHSDLGNVPSLRCLHMEITSLPMEDWCLNVPLKVRRNNTGIIHHGWDHFLSRSKVSGGHIYYLVGIFWSFKSFFLMSCQKKKKIVISVAVLQNLCDKKLIWTQSDFLMDLQFCSVFFVCVCVCPTF